MTVNNPARATAKITYTLKRSELPLHCPNDNMPLWSSHPRVYLEIEKTAEATCPYCGTRFKLVD